MEDQAKVSYGGCLRNYAAWLGRHATDGCPEFAQPTDPNSPFCLACGCHKNYHEKIIPVVKTDAAPRKTPGQLYMNSVVTRRLLGYEHSTSTSIEKKVEIKSPEFNAADQPDRGQEQMIESKQAGKKKVVNTKESLISFNWMKSSGGGGGSTSSSSSSVSLSKNA